MKIQTLALALLASTSFVACSSQAMRPAAPAMISGGMLVGSKGMTLYTFDKDVAGSGKSVCNDACATNWPPFFAMDGAAPSGDYSIVTRDDGKKQWALKGQPLYYWIKDQKAGDMSGDGVNKVWHIVKP